MARVVIYDKIGTPKVNSHGDRIYGKMKYVGQTLSVSYVEFTIASPYPIVWNIGDYVDYGAGIIREKDIRFYLFSIPQAKKEAEKGLYGGGFVYSNVQFHDPGQVLSLVPFVDLQVKNDNIIHFSTRDSLSTYENVAGIAARLQACADEYRLSLAKDNPFKGIKFYFRLCTSDSTVYERTIAPNTTEGGENAEAYEELITEERSVTMSGSVLDGLNDLQNVWEAIGWGMDFVLCSWTYENDSLNRIVKATEASTGVVCEYSYRNDASTVPSGIKDNFGQECGTLPERFAIVTIGGVNFVSNAGASEQFARHNGLVNIKKYITNQDEFLTRLVVYGSDRNLPSRYYNGEEILNADSVDIPNLMIPISEWGKTYGRVHDGEMSIDYTTVLNTDGSISVATAKYNNISYRYTYSYDSAALTYTVKDKTGIVVATGSYTASSFPGTEILPQTYSEKQRSLPDARKAYIEDSEKTSKYGVIVSTARFDSDDNGEIYPTIQGVTLGDVQEIIAFLPTATNKVNSLAVMKSGDDWVTTIRGLRADLLAEVKNDSAYRVMLLRRGYARRGKWYFAKDADNPRLDGKSTHTTRRYPNTQGNKKGPGSYQTVRRGYSNALPAMRYRIIGWDILTHGGMPVSSQLTYSTKEGKLYHGVTLATRLGAALKLPPIRKHDIYTNKAGKTFYLNSAKEGLTDLYVGLYHYEKGHGWVLVSNVVQVRGRKASTTAGEDNTKVWFGNTDNVILGE